jgi:hypothetical protein
VALLTKNPKLSKKSVGSKILRTCHVTIKHEPLLAPPFKQVQIFDTDIQDFCFGVVRGMLSGIGSIIESKGELSQVQKLVVHSIEGLERSIANVEFTPISKPLQLDQIVHAHEMYRNALGSMVDIYQHMFAPGLQPDFVTQPKNIEFTLIPELAGLSHPEINYQNELFQGAEHRNHELPEIHRSRKFPVSPQQIERLFRNTTITEIMRSKTLAMKVQLSDFRRD